MKKIIFAIIIVLTLLSGTAAGFAETENTKADEALYNITFTVGSDICYVNGEVQKLEQPIYLDETTGKAMLPIKSFCDIYGVEFSESRWYNFAGIKCDIINIEGNESSLEMYITDNPLEERVEADGSVKEWTMSASKYCTETYIYTLTQNDCKFVSLRFLAELLGFEVVWNDADQTIELKEKADDELFGYDINVEYQEYNGTLIINMELINRTPYYLSHRRGSRPRVFIYEDVNGEKGTCVYPIEGFGEYAVVDGKIISPNSTERATTSYTDLDLPKGKYICEISGYERIIYAGLRLAEIRFPEYRFEVSKDREYNILVNLAEGEEYKTIENLLKDIEYEYVEQMELSGSYKLKFYNRYEATKAIKILNNSDKVNYTS